MLGRLAAMTTVGVMVAIGLWAIGLPEFLALAILAALLDIVPYFGPIVAAIPAVLLALLDGPATAGWVIALYVAVQSIEGYILTPVIQQQTVELPPALTIAAIVLAGTMFGVVAILVATPLAVAVIVVVKMLYVEDRLGDQEDVPGATDEPADQAPPGS
jgi:predicted PurR-regulated permease PerM